MSQSVSPQAATRCMSCKRLQPLFMFGRCNSVRHRWFLSVHGASTVPHAHRGSAFRQQHLQCMKVPQRTECNQWSRSLMTQHWQHSSAASMATSATAEASAEVTSASAPIQSAAAKVTPIPLPTSDESEELLRIRHSVSFFSRCCSGMHRLQVLNCAAPNCPSLREATLICCHFGVHLSSRTFCSQVSPSRHCWSTLPSDGVFH
jgi:hypothetical protein